VLLLVVVAVGVRAAYWLLAPLVPGLIILGCLAAIYLVMWRGRQ
jgi:hypothetical protein